MGNEDENGEEYPPIFEDHMAEHFSLDE